MDLTRRFFDYSSQHLDAAGRLSLVELCASNSHVLRVKSLFLDCAAFKYLVQSSLYYRRYYDCEGEFEAFPHESNGA